jgi:ribosomal protein L29
MKAKKLREMSKEELEKLLNDVKNEILKARSNPQTKVKVRNLRKILARILTVMHEKGYI